MLGDGRLKAFGSWGRYYDWVKYELARGSFGGDTWLVSYRSLDTLDVNSLNLANMPGRDLWGGVRDRRVPNFDTIDPDLKPMFQDATNLGLEYQLNPTTAIGVNYVHNKLTRAIEDVGSLDATGNEIYFAANPGEGVAHDDVRDRPDGAASPTPKPLRQYDAVDFTISRRFSNNWFGSANLTISRLYGNYAGLANSDEITTPTTGTSSATAQQQARQHRASRHRRRPRVGPRRARVGLARQPRRSRPPRHRSSGRGQVLRLVPASVRHADRRVRLRRQRHADEHGGQHDQYHSGARQRPRRHGPHADAEPHRPARLARTRRPWQAAGSGFELNVINLFNQKTATAHLQLAQQGCRAGHAPIRRSICRASTSRSGYDYNALILASPSGANAYDPRYGQADLWQAGTQGQFSIKYLF